MQRSQLVLLVHVLVALMDLGGPGVQDPGHREDETNAPNSADTHVLHIRVNLFKLGVWFPKVVPPRPQSQIRRNVFGFQGTSPKMRI